ncbi:MAG: hypothetical protein K1Y36_29655, partial [Blastocatellia bacterium]|nr:hypothetical protein [Blastocatellia bacterium]
MAYKSAKDMVSRALALVRPTLRVNRLLVKALPQVDAEQHLVLLLSCTNKVLEVAIADGHPGSEPFALSLPRNQEFQVNLAKTLIGTINLTPIEIVRLRVEVKRHPRSVIEAAIAEHYPQPLEQQTSHEVAQVLEREYAEAHGILLVRVQGQVLLAYYHTAAGRRKLEDLVEAKEFRGKLADVVGHPEGHRRNQFLAGLVGDYRKVTRDFFAGELAKAYPISPTAALAVPEQQLRGPIERANLEHARSQPVAALPLRQDSDVRTIINALFRAAAQQRASDLKIRYDFKRKRLLYS